MQQPWRTKASLILAVALLVVLLTQEQILGLGVIRRLELATLDYRFQHRGVQLSSTDSTHVVIVEISEDAFRSLPDKFPWPRTYYARLVRNLKAAGAVAVGIDLILNSGDIYSPFNDDSLRDAIRATGIVVLAGKREMDNPQYVMTSSGENFGNIFMNVDTAIGLVNIRPDADALYRSYAPYFLVHKGGGKETAVPTFAFAVLNKYLGIPVTTTPQLRDDSFEYAARSIPRYEASSLLINFYGPNGTFPHIKFQDVIDDETFLTVDEATSGEQINTFSDPEFGYLYDGTFKGKIVLVGVTVPEYKDLFPVSIARGKHAGDNLMYGVEIHANVIENVLRNDFLREESETTEVLLIIFVVVLTFMVTSSLKASKIKRHFLLELGAFLFTLAEMVLIGFAAMLLFNSLHYVLTVISPMIAAISGYVASTTYHFVAERKQRMLIKSMFSTYVNPSVVDELIAHPETLVLGGKRQELTVLFSDIEGFTTISQKMEPERLVGLLNEYLSVMTNIVFKNDGTLDKYEGDAVMAFWGAPIPQDDHALRACRAALQMQQAVNAINTRWRHEDKPTLKIRIGIHTGEMVVGNMGAAGKFAYTVIGDSVNLASRLEGANKEYQTGSMVSQRTYDLVRHRILCRELDRITVRGRTEPVTTYELLQMIDDPLERELRQFLEHYARAMQLYHDGQWKRAFLEFGATLKLRPQDRPTDIHRARVKEYAKHPPQKTWNSSLGLKRK